MAPLQEVTAGSLIKSSAWNEMVKEINGKVNRAGDIMTGPLTIGGNLQVNGNTQMSGNLQVDGNWELGNRVGQVVNAWNKQFGMGIQSNTLYFRSNIEFGWHRGGEHHDGQLNPGTGGELLMSLDQGSLDVKRGVNARWFGLSTADNSGNGMSISRGVTNLDISMGSADRIFHLPGDPPAPPLFYKFRVGHYNNRIIGIGVDPFVTKLSVDQDGLLTVNGPIHAGNSDIYFTKTNHNHTAFGNKLGFAAIENSASHDGLMILGRTTGGDNGLRKVRLWDYLEVNGNIEVNGSALKTVGGGWATLSDKKLKKGIKAFSGALDKLSKLRGVNFEWKEPSLMANQEGVQTGFVAQEVEEVFPEWIITDSKGNKCIGFIGFEALVVESLKELKAEIQKIKTHLKI